MACSPQGHQAGEEVRLQKLGQLLYPSTRYLFEKAGIEPGMKVLDVGSDAGDVTLLLAELVGPTGSIVGVDVYPAVLEVARARVRAARLNNITFIAEDIRKVSLDNHFDAVVGRNVLMYVADPAEVLRICADHLQPRAVMAFQEFDGSIAERVDRLPSVARLVRHASPQ